MIIMDKEKAYANIVTKEIFGKGCAYETYSETLLPENVAKYIISLEERIEALEAKPKTLAQLQADAYRNPKRSNGNGSAY